MRSVLSAAESTKGQSRQFIKTNSRRVNGLMPDILDWLESYKDEYGFKYEAGEGGAWSLSGIEGDGAKAFFDFMMKEWRDFEPYAMTEDILVDIDGIGIEDEVVLAPLFIENQAVFNEDTPEDESETKDG